MDSVSNDYWLNDENVKFQGQRLVWAYDLIAKGEATQNVPDLCFDIMNEMEQAIILSDTIPEELKPFMQEEVMEMRKIFMSIRRDYRAWLRRTIKKK